MNQNIQTAALPESKSDCNRMLLFVAGQGGLLFGVGVGIFAGALPYLEATSSLNAGQLSFIVAAGLLSGAISTVPETKGKTFAEIEAYLVGNK
jgi:hypothetical protein